jgi:DNA replication protein DnaD
VKVVEADHKAKKMIRITMEVENETIRDILISGDFFMIPEDASHKLESALIGNSLNRNELLHEIQNFYNQTSVETSGVDPIDFVDAIMKVASV